MSRGVRDLRDMICVSRLTFHDSDEEEIISDSSNSSGKLNNEFALLSLSRKCSELRFSSSNSCTPNPHVVSPDSGFITSESPGNCSADVLDAPVVDHLANGNETCLTSSNDKLQKRGGPLLDTSKSVKSEKKRRKKKTSMVLNTSNDELSQLDQQPSVQRTSEAVNVCKPGKAKPIHKPQQKSQNKKLRTNFDDILTYMDATVLTNWLTQSNAAIQELASYCNKGDNFVQFAHFWLSEFSDLQKREIFSMEYEILLNEMALAFSVGRESLRVSRQDMIDLCGAVFKEYPLKLLKENGPHVFLDYLDTLSSEKQDRFKRLLSDVRCSTSNHQYAQWLLATRSFALVSVWSAVLNFFRNLIGESLIQSTPVPELCSSIETVPQRRLLQALRLGYIDVIHYLFVNGHVSPAYTDSHRRSLLFMAVMVGQNEVVRYLMASVPAVIDINQPADTGNTALHAAANSGNVAIVELLCQRQDVDVNCTNPQCDKATPLHLAVMHGHVKVVECLLRHGADPRLKMGNTSARDLAQDFGHREILALLKK